MKLPLTLLAIVSLSASTLVPVAEVETDTGPNVAHLAKRNWPKFVEHLRGMFSRPCHPSLSHLASIHLDQSPSDCAVYLNMPSQRKAIHALDAPKPNGNYSHVVREGNTLHIAGWMGDDPTTGTIVEGGIEGQTVQAIKNIQTCLEAAGSSLDKVVRRRIYIMDMKEFRKVDKIWGEWFAEPWPVSTCVQISGLAKEGALVELEVVAEV
ncbi:uncharacterized protein N0V89_000459 [Didymosphaeria variabile]|uniref:YjgF-like protein n=1 Tax=Didymosphaeria variabile TaxID=1932322 RepID=A0A9W8XUB8_9PLEO|nr:uncharacterized protein N0V89_000459 [Didymosphaeria variabile]KAJ4359902.1 hypothetical protein N0V89_000459 [Didymosphaeria variabile]